MNKEKKSIWFKGLNSSKKILLTLLVITLFIALFGLTYAWFSNLLTGLGNNFTVKTARLGIIYTDNSPEVILPDALPGEYIVKTFTVENISEEEAEYEIYMKDYLNTFINDEIVYSLSETTNGIVVEETPFLETMSIEDTIAKEITILGGETHTYELTIKFLETGSNQNSNMGAEFSGTIQIRETTSNALAQFKITSITIDEEPSGSVPTASNYILDNYTCTNGVVAEWDSYERVVYLANTANNNTECNLNFKQLKFKEVVAGGDATDVKSKSYLIGLTEDGDVYTWGWNGYGQLGDGTLADKIAPTVPVMSNVKAISSGGYHAIALTESGEVYTWGYNYHGQLGDGTTVNKTTPQGPIMSGVKAISGGTNHTMALTESGEVYTWGYNYYGQLGDGTIGQYGGNANKSVPTGPIITGVKAIAGGVSYTVTLTETGEVYTWGNNDYGQLGNGTSSHYASTPTGPIMSGVKAIDGGLRHIIALTEMGDVYTWGDNYEGQLGDGTSGYKNTPQGPIMSGIKEIAGGMTHTIALTESGEVYTWGYNEYGQLGDGTTVDKSIPTGPIMNGVKAISSGGRYTIAITESGEIHTWGGDSTELVGGWSPMGRSTPTGPIMSKVKAIAGGRQHTMVLTESGEVYTWGWNVFGQLGDGTKVDKSAPQGPIMTGVKALTGGNGHTVALTETGEVYVWGNNYSGQVGDGGVCGKECLSPQGPIMSGVKAISALFEHTIVLTEAGEVYAWGNNEYGQLGDGTTVNKNTPQGPIMSDVKAVSAGGYHSIVLTESGEVYTFGSNFYGELGNGTSGSSTNKTIPQGPIMSGVKSIAGGFSHSIALTETGEVFTWGWGPYGQLGNGTSGNGADKSTPQGPIMTGVKDIAGGASHSIALNQSGDVYTWGDNYFAQLGDGTTTSKNIPAGPVMSDIKVISGGDNHTIAITETGEVYTWGWNRNGALGIKSWRTKSDSLPDAVMFNPPTYMNSSFTYKKITSYRCSAELELYSVADKINILPGNNIVNNLCRAYLR